MGRPASLEQVARELAAAGTPLGVCLLDRDDGVDVVGVDFDGVLWVVNSSSGRGTFKAQRATMVRWCLESSLVVYPSSGSLVGALCRGEVLGLLPNFARSVAVLLP